MYESGAYVADHVEPLREGQIQPNGVDLTLRAILEQVRPGRLGRDGKTVGDRQELEPEDGIYRINSGGYLLRYAETVSIPENHIGFIYPRSSLMRNSCMLNTAVWDAGYEGKGEGLLQVYHPVELERGARVAQLVLAKADHEGTYDGSYQNEHL